MKLALNRVFLQNKFHSKQLLRIQIQRFGVFNNFTKTEDIVDKNKNTYEEFYNIDEQLHFENGRYLLSSSNTSEITTFRSFQMFLITPINMFFGYKLVKSMILLRPIKSIFWGLLFLGASKINYGIIKNLQHFIDKIYLLEDGQRTEFTLYVSQKKFITENIKIRKVNQKEVMFIMTLSPHIFDKFVPIIIDNKIYFIAKENDITNKPLFSAVMNGNTILMKRDKNEKVIDIK